MAENQEKLEGFKRDASAYGERSMQLAWVCASRELVFGSFQFMLL